MNKGSSIDYPTFQRVTDTLKEILMKSVGFPVQIISTLLFPKAQAI